MTIDPKLFEWVGTIFLTSINRILVLGESGKTSYTDLDFVKV